jgi:hypothetical protein
MLNGSDKSILPFWATKILSVWLTTAEFIELVLTSLTIEVAEVAFPVSIVESGVDGEVLFEFVPVELSLFPEGVGSLVVASGVAIIELSPLLAFDWLLSSTWALFEMLVSSGVGVGVGVSVAVIDGSGVGVGVSVGVSVGVVPIEFPPVLEVVLESVETVAVLSITVGVGVGVSVGVTS